MKCTKSIILTALLSIFVVGGVSYFLLHKDTRVPNITPTAIQPFVGDKHLGDEPTTPTDTPPIATDTLSYYIPEMGVHFEYPTYATVTVDILKGTTGQLLSGNIRLSGNQSVPFEGKSISFGGMTDDFSWPKGCDGGCTTGYSKIGDIYYYNRSTREGSILNVSYTLTTKDGTEAIIITGDKDLPPNTITRAFVNTNNPRFRGIEFSGDTETPEDRAIFESILRSIELK